MQEFMNFISLSCRIVVIDRPSRNGTLNIYIYMTILTCFMNIDVQPVGRMVLNKNIDNFFNENEQLAFSPGVVPPGIYYSNDKMLQCRIFAYGDTQRHRLGPNYLLLPVNAPKCAHHNNHHEGAMNFTHRDEEVSCKCPLLIDLRCLGHYGHATNNVICIIA